MTARQAANQMLDRIKTKHQVTSDEALAALLGVSFSTLIRWRQGKSLGRFARALVLLLDEQPAKIAA